MRSIARTNGPYLNKQTGRRQVTIYYEDKTRRTTTYARHLMEQHLGYELPRELEVDHIDNDKTNDALENLQVLTKVLNTQKHYGPEGPAIKRRARDVEMWTFTCPVCSAEVEKEAWRIRKLLKRGGRGPFCSRACAGRDTMNVRWHNSPAPRPTLPCDV